MRILAVEDSMEFQILIMRTLGEYQVVCVATVDEAESKLRNESFDLILIDINLPGRDGYSLLSGIQGNNELAEIPVLCLTGRTAVTDKIAAFSLGADDYLTKPFNPLELKARIEAKLKKVGRQKKKDLLILVGDIEIDLSRHRVATIDNSKRNEINLTQTEFKILVCLARRPEQIYSRDQLLVAAWGEDARVLDRVVDTHICTIRKKMHSKNFAIKAVTGLGYKLQAIKPKVND
jgi:DNA-binding response OmpR family regulator